MKRTAVIAVTKVLTRTAAFAASLVVRLGAQTLSMPPNDAPALNGFGAVVAIGNGEVFVAEPTNRFRPGLVYLYGRDGDGRWTERGTLQAINSAIRDRFGRAMAVDGNTLAVSSAPRDSAAVEQIHLFTRSASSGWQETATIDAPRGASDEGFGTSLAMTNGTIFVGAPSHGDSTGAVYLFQNRNGIWQAAGSITATQGKPGDKLGSALLVAGNRLFSGIPDRDSKAGGVLQFVNNANGWVEAPSLTGTSLKAGDRFGASVAVRGNRAWVGVPGRAGGAVAVFNFDSTSNAWREGTPLQPFDGTRNSSFGSSLAVTDEGLWVGVPGNNNNGGVLHLYGFDGDRLTRVERLSSGSMVSDEGLGNTLAVKGSVAVVGITGADLGAGKALIFERQNGDWVASAPLVSQPESMASVTGDQIRCRDGEASEFSCNQVDLVSFLPVSQIGGVRGMRLNDLWGWTDSSTNREYVMIGRSDGTSFVDMTDASHPRYLGDLPKTPGSRTAVWRDIKVYRNHAYIVADGAGQHGVQIFDLTRLRQITTPETFKPDNVYTNIASAHNIVIDEETGFGYAVGASSGGETCGGGLHMIDLREPMNPKFVGCHTDGVTGRSGTGYSHDAQCLVYRGPDQDYKGHEICVGANETALSLADVTDKSNTKVIATVTYPKVAYAHQGWFSEDQRWFFSNDEIDEANGSEDHTRTLVWDMSDLDDPVLLKEYFATTTETDHNLYVHGRYMYQSNTGAGLRIIDVADPANPREVGYFDTDPDGSGGGTWSNYPYFKSGVIPVTGGFAGIFFVRFREQVVP